MKSTLAMRLAAVESVLGSQETVEVALFSSELDGEALDESIARWRNGKDLPGAPEGIRDRKSDQLIVLVDLK